MAGGKSTYLQNAMLNGVFNAQYTIPGTVFVGLWTTTLSAASTGATSGEPSGGSYARVAKASGTANWPAASGGSISNGVAITFTTATADWGTATYFGVVDASSNGNMLYWGPLGANKVIQNGDTASFAINALSIQET